MVMVVMYNNVYSGILKTVVTTVLKKVTLFIFKLHYGGFWPILIR